MPYIRPSDFDTLVSFKSILKAPAPTVEEERIDLFPPNSYWTVEEVGAWRNECLQTGSMPYSRQTLTGLCKLIDALHQPATEYFSQPHNFVGTWIILRNQPTRVTISDVEYIGLPLTGVFNSEHRSTIQALDKSMFVTTVIFRPNSPTLTQILNSAMKYVVLHSFKKFSFTAKDTGAEISGYHGKVLTFDRWLERESICADFDKITTRLNTVGWMARTGGEITAPATKRDPTHSS